MKDKELADFTEYLISVSAFSKGQTSEVIEKVAEKNQKYVILKNNRPKAVLISLKDFRDIAAKAEKYEALVEKMDEMQLLKQARDELSKYDIDNAPSYDDLLKEFGFEKSDMEKESASVELE